ncbi:uncharacterized protein with HXXEE motif [Kineothrix alysoides]|uniref:Uncharacterized protein with HXXEE motif n=1 Tax=Kineothrix alysoides TaxID=1469948 RepID=A0A4V2QBC0_9FIRM|nr:HXXEE domain-containing protein [Kineothrix alysoides]TCL55622.1 uncharacterized protein with HXXEE motif [Kineothrix alysoides]
MGEIYFLIWLFPLLFIFHDFEEIIFGKPWVNRNKERLMEQFPMLANKVLLHFDSLTTSSFSLGVAEEFILISAVTIISYLTGWYDLWLGIFIAFIAHLIIHIFQCIIFRGYVPAVVTSVICLPVSICITAEFLRSYSITFSRIIAFSMLGIVLMIINIWGIHKGMTVFDKWLAKYQKG